MTTQQTPTTCTARTPRASCRVACVVAAVLVTLGGLRLLVAGESVHAVHAAPVAAVSVIRPVRAVGPVDVGVHGATTADFRATVEHTARKIECVPVACGFSRVQSLGGLALDWTALEQRVLVAMRPTYGVEESAPPVARLVAWDMCGLDCPERLRDPEALAASF